MRRILIEWRFDDRSWNALSADLDLERVSLLRSLGRQIARADRNAERGAHGAAAHHATRLVAVEHGITVAGDVAIAQREADEFFLDAGRLLLVERRAADELSLLELHEPVEIRLERRDRVVDVVAVERHSHLETQRVAGAESGRRYVARGHERVPEARRVL